MFRSLDPDIKKRAIVACSIVSVALLLPVITLVVFYPRFANTKTLYLGDLTAKVHIADTDAEREKGLSGSSELASGQGMLFVYPSDGYHGIWMKDMAYPIDIVWLNADKAIVHTEEYVLPSSYPRVYVSRVPARYVVELPAGTLDDKMIQPGAVARF